MRSGLQCRGQSGGPPRPYKHGRCTGAPLGHQSSSLFLDFNPSETLIGHCGFQTTQRGYSGHSPHLCLSVPQVTLLAVPRAVSAPGPLGAAAANNRMESEDWEGTWQTTNARIFMHKAGRSLVFVWASTECSLSPVLYPSGFLDKIEISDLVDFPIKQVFQRLPPPSLEAEGAGKRLSLRSWPLGGRVGPGSTSMSQLVRAGLPLPSALGYILCSGHRPSGFT